MLFWIGTLTLLFYFIFFVWIIIKIHPAKFSLNITFSTVMIEFSVSVIVVICAKILIFKSYAGTVRKQSKAACGFLAFMPAENSFHCQCCKLKTMFTGRFPSTQNSIEKRYDAVQTSDQGVNKKRLFAGPDSMSKEKLVDVRAGDSLGCSDHGAVELKTLRGGSRPKAGSQPSLFQKSKIHLCSGASSPPLFQATVWSKKCSLGLDLDKELLELTRNTFCLQNLCSLTRPCLFILWTALETFFCLNGIMFLFSHFQRKFLTWSAAGMKHGYD